MKKMILSAVLCMAVYTAVYAQAQHDAFAKDKELQTGLLKYDLKEFVDEPVLFTCDTVEKKVGAAELATLMKMYFPATIKNTVIKKASETNNGYVQSFGLYQGDDALYYVRFNLNPLTGKLEEVVVEKNN